MLEHLWHTDGLALNQCRKRRVSRIHCIRLIAPQGAWHGVAAEEQIRAVLNCVQALLPIL